MHGNVWQLCEDHYDANGFRVIRGGCWHLDGSQGQGQAVPEAAFNVTARDTSERVELAAARDPLDRLAAATNGRVFADHEAGQLPPLLHARTRTITRTVETRLWDQPAALLLFFAILTVEWLARKRVGLP